MRAGTAIPIRLITLVSLAMLPATLVEAAFPWKAKFTKASSPVLAAIDEQIHGAHPGELKGYAIQGRTWSEEDFRLEIESGTLWLEPPIEGVTAGAFFEGKAVFSFTPRPEGARGNLRTAFGRSTLEKVPVETAYIFSLRGNSPLLAWTQGTPVAGAPSRAAVYQADKSAMRQMGMEVTACFLNRDGPARGTTYVLMPMQEIRKTGSAEARVLYKFNPTSGLSVGFAVFGHEELTPVRPFKFIFHTLASYSGNTPSPGTADVERSSAKIVPGAGSVPASEEATLQLKLAPGVRGVRFLFTPTMEVSAITDGEGHPRHFLQWKELKTNADLDVSLLVQVLDDPAPAKGAAASITVASAGRLFEPWGDLYLLIAEDGWVPHFFSHDAAQHELELTIPKDLVAVGAGEKVMEEVDGLKKKVVFRTTQPNDGSTFYYGDYTVSQATVEGVAVELYQSRKSLAEMKSTRYVLDELTGALSFLTKTLGPLDIKSLRAVSTPTLHARGFEGLILMGQMARQTNTKYFADISRAHEVAHQWFGNYVRIKHWPRDRWLMESLADYMAMEYYAFRAESGAPGNHPGDTLEAIRKRWFEPLTFGTTERKNLAGQTEELEGSTIYPLVAATNNVHTKGPFVLRMLKEQFRLQQREAAFPEMLKDFLGQYRYQPASTDDFMRVAEKHLGAELDWFFKQWVADGGVPVLVWNAETVPQGQAWAVKLEARQEQRSYRLDVPVRVRYAGGKADIFNWHIEGDTPTHVIETAEKPTDVSLNDDLTSLVVLRRMKAR